MVWRTALPRSGKREQAPQNRTIGDLNKRHGGELGQLAQNIRGTGQKRLSFARNRYPVLDKQRSLPRRLKISCEPFCKVSL